MINEGCRTMKCSSSRAICSSLFCLFLLALAVRAAEPASGLSPQDAAKAMKVPDGFSVTLFAGEPDVVQPAAFEFDDRGRLWVAEFNRIRIGKPKATTAS